MQTFKFRYLNPENESQSRHLYASQVVSKQGFQLYGQASHIYGLKPKHMHQISNTVKPEIETMQIVNSQSNERGDLISMNETVERLVMEKQKLQWQLEQQKEQFLFLAEKKAQLKCQQEMSLFQIAQQQANLSLANQACQQQLSNIRSLFQSKQQQSLSH